MVREFEKIEVPNPEMGLTERQRDRLSVDMAKGINYLGEAVKQINNTVQQHNIEIYGDKNYEGLKSMTHSNSRLVNIITKILITAGILGAMGLGIVSYVGGG